MKYLLSVVLLGCFSVIQGQWDPPNPLPTPDPTCPVPTCDVISQFNILLPTHDTTVFWQCGGNGTHYVLFTLPCPPFQFFTYANQRCDFIEQFIPVCTGVPPVTPPPVTPPPVTPPPVTPPPVTPPPVTPPPVTPPPVTPPPVTPPPVTPPPNVNCPCPCPCIPWFPCQPCQTNCSCSG